MGLRALLKGPTAVQILSWPHQGSNRRPCGSKSSLLTTMLQAAPIGLLGHNGNLALRRSGDQAIRRSGLRAVSFQMVVRSSVLRLGVNYAMVLDSNAFLRFTELVRCTGAEETL